MVPEPKNSGCPDVRTNDRSSVPDGERIVISGMSGLFPQSRHVKDLADILYEKKNPITEESCRWKYSHPEVPNFTGNIPGLEYFDAQFFKVHFRLAEYMDAMSRKTLEMAFQAIYDAGISPQELYGKKVGVYTGSCFSETEKALFYGAHTKTGFGIAGCSKTMFANRISYWLNAKGPSMSVDEACCSSLAALEQAYQAIERGECEAAIIGGCNLCLHPQSSVHYARIIKLCKDGKTKSFDENADGCAKSEAINVLFLQKAKDAKRIYAEVLHVKNTFHELLKAETGPRYGFYRDPMNMADFIRTFYKEANVPPEAVEYVEAFGSAVPEADRSELEAIEEVFCKNRQDPLLVGSVMSNIGYSEAASGISAIIKVLLGYENGKIAANLHCNNPRRDIAALKDGRMEIVTDHKEFRRTYTAINGISVTGVNAHVLLKGHYKPKDLSRYKSAIPHLVTISARQDITVQKMLDDLKSRPIDPEELALFHNLHQNPISGHLGRGYIILGTNSEGETMSLSETANYFDDAKRPLWFVYSGMGSQWAGMGAHLMRIPIFASAIERCHAALKPKGIDIVHIITSQDKTIFDNILNSFVGIAAIQIGLTDVLTSLGLVPDNIIGHSVGELGCAYADGCLTAEEMILAAYCRGLVSIQTPFIFGSMAAVGVGYQQIKEMIPPEIEVACHNGPESSTISGPADIMKKFVSELTDKGIFAKEVPCSNIAYHSRYIAKAGPGLLKFLSEVIKDPKPRSEKWLSTSVPQDKWKEPLAKSSSAEYHTNNLLSSVLFEETSRLIPANAVLVEIAPHGLLQAILKRSLPESCKHIPLTRRGHTDNAFMVLDAIGKLYMEGYNPKIENLYPKIEFPVSTGTPMLSHLVEWAHQEKWKLPLYCNADKQAASASKSIISTYDDKNAYLKGHIIRGKNLFPFSAVLVIVWDTLAMSLGAKRRSISVEFRDVYFYAQPPLHDRRQLALNVLIHRGNGSFEVLDDDRKVARGYITSDIDETYTRDNIENNEKLDLDSDDIYQLLHERDYHYKDEFRSLYKTNSCYTEAQIIWNDNWETFLDGIFQLNVLRIPHTTVSMTKYLRKLHINITDHLKNKEIEVDGKIVMAAHVDGLQEFTNCGGVTLEHVRFRNLWPLEEARVDLKTLNFVPHFATLRNVNDILEVQLQIVAENLNKDSINLIEIVDSDENVRDFEGTRKILDGISGFMVNYETVTVSTAFEMRDHFVSEVDVVLVKNLSTDDNLCQNLYVLLARDTFVINVDVESSTYNHERPSALYRVVAAHNTKTEKFELLKWRPSQTAAATTVVSVRSASDLNLLKSTQKDITQRHKLVVISPYPPVPGLKELIKLWRKDVKRNQIYLIMMLGNENLDQLPELDSAYTVINKGVKGGEYYTSYQEKPQTERKIALRSGKIGDLNSLQWVEKPEPVVPGVKVTVHYAAINKLDVKYASGVIPFKATEKCFEPSYCMDFSGVTDSGERVMGILPTGAASRRVTARPDLLWPVPKHWSLEDAVTVPSAYLHALYCFELNTFFRRGYTILVHGGAGALGQAAIAVALGCGCEVFATVSEISKKKFLMKLFPELKADHIGNSRDPTFADMVLNFKKPKGYTVVVGCVQGELKDITIKCSNLVIDSERILNQEAYKFGMNHLNYDRSYIEIDFTSIFTQENLKDVKVLQHLLSEGIAKGYVRPLSRVTYSPEEVTRAFRLIASSQHRGRVVLRLQDAVPLSQMRLLCSPEACHVVICDEDNFGVQLAERLVVRGVRNLVLHRSTVTPLILIKKECWENDGVKVILSSEDLIQNMANFLNESSSLGPIEGVYVVATNASEQSVVKVNQVISSLDWASRKICLSMRYFVVVSSGLTVGQHTCINRAKDGLQATAINLNMMTKESDGFVKDWKLQSAALNAIERAARSQQPILKAVPQRNRQPSLLDQICQLAEIQIPEGKSAEATLGEMNMEVTLVPIVKNFLRDNHNLSLDDEQILNLTPQKIQQLEDMISPREFRNVRGLATFFSFVDPDELMATTELVFLPTLTSSGVMRDDDFDVSKRYLTIIPGMEGHHERFRMLCERLKMPAIVLQPGLDSLHESISDTAERYAKLLLKKIEIKNNFYLLGYESGVLIALEVAAILEKHGLTGTVYCVGGTPEEIQATILDQISEYKSEESLQDAVARYMFSLMTGNDEGLDQALINVSSWSEKVDACVRTLLGRVAHSSQYARAWIYAAYTRLAQIKSYKPQPRQLESQLILLRASGLSKKDLNGTSSSMQRYSKKPVVVYRLRAPLADSIYDLSCGAIVNRYLDDEIQQAFDESNLCIQYLTNPDFFMAASNI